MEITQYPDRAIQWFATNKTYKVKGIFIGDLAAFCRATGLPIMTIRALLNKNKIANYDDWEIMRETEEDMREELAGYGVPLTPKTITGRYVMPIEDTCKTDMDKTFESILRECERLKQLEKEKENESKRSAKNKAI